MAIVISLAEYRRRRESADSPRAAAFYFDVASPFTYLAAERVERLIPVVSWRPVLADDTLASEPAEEAAWACAHRRADALRLPLVRPERGAAQAVGATRAAAFAAELGRASSFVLAASRLAYCGGFDLSEADVLAEAAAAAGLPLEDCLRAAHDPRRDASLRAAGDHVAALGAHQLPTLVVGSGVFCGERHIAEAVAASRAAQAARHA